MLDACICSFSPKETVPTKNKHEGQKQNKSNLHKSYKPSLFRWDCTVQNVFEGHENGLSSVFSSLAEIQKFIGLLCPNFVQNFYLQLLLEKQAASVIVMNRCHKDSLSQWKSPAGRWKEGDVKHCQWNIPLIIFWRDKNGGEKKKKKTIQL